MFGFAKKIGMTNLFINGKSTSVTALLLGDNTFVKATETKDGYKSLQLAAFPRKSPKTKATAGHIAKHAHNKDLGVDFYCLAEFSDKTAPEGKTGFTIDDVKDGQMFKVTGVTKGRGFTGVVKRWDFKGLPRSHGHDHVRHAGSIGSRYPQSVMKGKKMPGRYGGENLTIRGLKVVAIDLEKKLFFVAGSVPGPNTGYVKFEEQL
jgi:large subunit ribosomal protein L3